MHYGEDAMWGVMQWTWLQKQILVSLPSSFFSTSSCLNITCIIYEIYMCKSEYIPSLWITCFWWLGWPLCRGGWPLRWSSCTPPPPPRPLSHSTGTPCWEEEICFTTILIREGLVEQGVLHERFLASTRGMYTGKECLSLHWHSLLRFDPHGSRIKEGLVEQPGCGRPEWWKAKSNGGRRRGRCWRRHHWETLSGWHFHIPSWKILIRFLTSKSLSHNM